MPVADYFGFCIFRFYMYMYVYTVHVVAIFNLHHSGTQFFLGDEGTLFRPENSLAPFSGGFSDVGPKTNRCIKVRKTQVCADLKVKVRRKSPWCVDLDLLRSISQFVVCDLILCDLTHE